MGPTAPEETPHGGPPTGWTQQGPYSHPIYPRLAKSIKRICSKYGRQTHFKGNRTIKELLVKPKDKDPMEKKGGPSTFTSVGNLHVMRDT